MNYEPLVAEGGQIRLLTFRNRQVQEQYERAEEHDQGSALNCDLDVFPFRGRSGPGRRRSSAAHGAVLPGFLALSYAWAEDSRRRRVSVNGDAIDVSGNLNSCLEALEASPIVRDVYRVWADAVCINQSDVLERNREVARMRDLYKGASYICIWLGMVSDNSDLAFDFICGVAHAWGRGREEARKYLRSVLRRDGVELFRALSRLIARSYWYRCWIIQELACGDEDTLIMCGGKTAVWGDFLLTYSNFRPYRQAQETELSTMFRDELQQADAQIMESYRQYVFYYEWDKCDELARIQVQMTDHACCDTAVLLGRVRRASCTLPEDKVYGILGLFRHDIASRIVIDYTLPFTEVYLMFARAYAEAGNELNVFLESGQEEDTELVNAGMPSWVPDLRFQQRHFRGGNEPEYNAHGGMHAYIEKGADIKVLRAKGIMIDVIDGVSGQMAVPLEEVPDDLQHSISNISIYGDFEATSEALWRALIGNRDLSGDQPNDDYRSLLQSALLNTSFRPLGLAKRHNLAAYALLLHQFIVRNRALRIAGRELGEYFRGVYSTADEFDPSWEHTDPGLLARPYTTAVRRCREFMYARRLATTASGYIAVLPHKARSGDRVAIFPGCSCPMLLRATVNGFKVVCACYVQGLMDGQVVQMLQTGTVVARIIDLV